MVAFLCSLILRDFHTSITYKSLSSFQSTQFVSITIADEFMLFRYTFLTVLFYCSGPVTHAFLFEK